MTDVSTQETPLRVLHVTDTHLFAAESDDLAGVRTEQTCLEVLSHVRSEAGRLDLVLHTGDLVHDYSAAAYSRLRERLLDFGVPTLVIPGNHDHADEMRRQFAMPPVTWQFQTVVGNWLIVMLDSSIHGEPGGRLQPAELEQLNEVLEALPQLHALVCLHHHPVAMGSEWIDQIGVENGEALFRVLDRHTNVRAVLWGHVHQTFDGERQGVRLMATPSTCIQFKPGQREFALDALPPGYRVLELHPNGEINSRLFRLKELPQGLRLGTEGYS